MKHTGKIQFYPLKWKSCYKITQRQVFELNSTRPWKRPHMCILYIQLRVWYEYHLPHLFFPWVSITWLLMVVSVSSHVSHVNPTITENSHFKALNTTAVPFYTHTWYLNQGFTSLPLKGYSVLYWFCVVFTDSDCHIGDMVIKLYRHSQLGT